MKLEYGPIVVINKYSEDGTMETSVKELRLPHSPRSFGVPMKMRPVPGGINLSFCTSQLDVYKDGTPIGPTFLGNQTFYHIAPGERIFCRRPNGEIYYRVQVLSDNSLAALAALTGY